MSQNYDVTEGSGSRFAADEATIHAETAKIPVVKISHGAAGAHDGVADNATPLPVHQYPVTSGGCSIHKNIDIDESGDNIKSSAGQIYGYHFSNSNASARFVKLYNKASAPTVGTDTPVITIMIPGNGAVDLAIPGGIPFATGIGIGATTAVGDSDTGAPGANEVIGTVFYK